MNTTARRLDEVLPKIPGWAADKGRVRLLKGGITNENFRVDVDGESFVLRLGGSGTRELGIARGREYVCARIAARLGIGAPVLRYLRGPDALVTGFIAGRLLSPAAARKPAMIKRIVAAIKSYHGGPRFPGLFSPFLTVRSYHALSRRALGDFGGRIPRALGLMGAIEQALGRGVLCPCHNDLLASNIIDDGDVVRILDWEYAAMGDPFFDLGNFAVNQSLSQEQCRLLLCEYSGEVKPQKLARLNLYRMASDLREAFWGFVQAKQSRLNFDFKAYGVKHLGRFLKEAGSPFFQRWLKEAA